MKKNEFYLFIYCTMLKNQFFSKFFKLLYKINGVTSLIWLIVFYIFVASGNTEILIDSNFQIVTFLILA